MMTSRRYRPSPKAFCLLVLGGLATYSGCGGDDGSEGPPDGEAGRAPVAGQGPTGGVSGSSGSASVAGAGGGTAGGASGSAPVGGSGPAGSGGSDAAGGDPAVGGADDGQPGGSGGETSGDLCAAQPGDADCAVCLRTACCDLLPSCAQNTTCNRCAECLDTELDLGTCVLDGFCAFVAGDVTAQLLTCGLAECTPQCGFD